MQTNGISCEIDGTGGFAPENNLNIDVNTKIKNNISKEEFNSVIDEVTAIYKPIIEGNGKDFIVNRHWYSGTVNASAQQKGDRWVINMYGGLARHELITRDGFAIVVCHEIGHHLAGAPKKTIGNGRNTTIRWASNEGQSDYFASLKCFRKVYAKEDNISFISTLVIPKKVEGACRSIYQEGSKYALCIRSSMAAQSTTNLLSSLSRGRRGRDNNKPLTDFNKPDLSVVLKTTHSHPKAQCRLDTYFAAALCDIDMNIDLDNANPRIGACNRIDDQHQGARSLCWYKPTI